MSTKLRYQRVLLKISGEALKGGREFGYDPAAVAAYRPVKEMFELCYRSMLPVYTEMARR